MPILVLALLAAVPTCPAADAAAAAPESLAWLAGSWSGDDQGTFNEEVWTPPSGGLLLAMHRDVKAGRQVGFEFLRVEAVQGRLSLRAMPGGRPATDFAVVELGEGCVAFARPGAGFPARVRYWREGEVLHARIESAKGDRFKAWAWTRAAAAAPAAAAAQAPMTPPATATAGAEPGPTDTDPDKYRVVLENERVRVLRYHDVPGAKTAQHRHPDSVLVALTGFQRRLHFPDGTARDRTFQAGDVMWVPAQSHVGENVGATGTEVLLVEPKSR